MSDEIVIDTFAGGGGASTGIARALGRDVDVAINHDADALAMHAANHPHTRHLTEDVWKANPRAVIGGRPVGLLWLSPDCKHFSRAKGGKPVEKKIRSLAWVAIKWAAEVRPRLLILENVREFEDWGPLQPRWDCAACDWRGTEGQTLLARQRRRCPRCESVRLRPTAFLLPDPARKGLTFRRFTGRLRALGYQAEWRVLNAADYGAPTHRRRLFLIARCDGATIVWPEPTHGDPAKIRQADLFGPGRAPWRTAAECIDWSLPCPSIFERQRPLADKTLRRIALGIKRYVLDHPRPFIVAVGHGGGGTWGDSRSSSLASPLGTIHAGGGNHALVAPLLARIGQTGGNGKYANAVGEPLGTLVSKAEHLLVAPHITKFRGDSVGSGIDEPLPTVTSGAGAARPAGAAHAMGVVAATLIQTGYAEREGQAPRCLDLGKPLGTVVGTGKHAAVTAFLAKHFGGVVGQPMDRPTGTITAIDHHGLVAANLVHLNHGDKQCSGADEPLRTITASGNHAALVCSFLTKYFGTSIGAHLLEPAPTATGKDRFGIVTVEIGGEPYVIVDIGLRMLQPHELARAQGFPDDYVLTGSKSNQVARIGNSVPPVMAEVLTAANYHPAPVEV